MDNLIPTIKYAWLTLKHKWFVLVIGIKIGVPMRRLILHDMSKFFPSELPHYGRQFFGKADRQKDFINCWIHHQNHNPHHWEYWIPRTGHNRCEPPYPDNKPVRMPKEYLDEMIADWFGASRVYEGKWPTRSNWKWYEKSFPEIAKRIHPEDAAYVEKIIHISLW